MRGPLVNIEIKNSRPSPGSTRPTGPPSWWSSCLADRGRPRPRARVVVQPRHRRPGPDARRRRCRPGSCTFGARPARGARRPPRRTVTPRSTRTSWSLAGDAAARAGRSGAHDRGVAGQRVDGQRARRASRASRAAGVDAVITDVPDLALERARERRDDRERVGHVARRRGGRRRRGSRRRPATGTARSAPSVELRRRRRAARCRARRRRSAAVREARARRRAPASARRRSAEHGDGERVGRAPACGAMRQPAAADVGVRVGVRDHRVRARRRAGRSAVAVATTAGCACGGRSGGATCRRSATANAGCAR